MTQYLLSVSVGPVQEFIAAARKTADLSAGSDLLREIVGAVVATFPNPDPTEGTDRGQRGLIFPLGPEAGGANKVLGIVDDPERIVSEAKLAARATLGSAWDAALGALSSEQRAVVDIERAAGQLDTFLEVYAAWVPVESATYAESRAQVDRLLAGRKALRNFSPTANDDVGLSNSPLDPSRPSVVTAPYIYKAPAALSGRPVYLKPTEVLDAVSLMKRLRGRSLRVPSTRDLAQRSSNEGFTNPKGDDDSDSFIPRQPYFAILVADGDRMGALLNARPSIADHRTVSASLDRFAAEARELVDYCDGLCVYAGGDDVLALLPVTTALECATMLSDEFRSRVTGATLSVGLAIVHHRQPLSVSLAQARHAERVAKVERDSLAVALHTRAGAPRIISQTWDTATFRNWFAHTQKGLISRGLPYQLERLALQWPQTVAEDMLTGEVRRVIDHSRPRVLAQVSDDLPELRSAPDLAAFASLLVTARFLSGVGE